MKPERRKKVTSLRASLRKRFKRGTKPAPINHKLVQVCDLKAYKTTKEKTPSKSRSMASTPGPGQDTPLGTPSCKKPTLDHGRTPAPPVPPLDLVPPAALGETEVKVIDSSFQEDLSDTSANISAASSSSSLTIESFRNDLSGSSSFSSFVLEESSERSYRSDEESLYGGPGDDTDGSRTPPGDSADSVQFSDKYRLVPLQSGSSYLLLLPHGNTRLPVRGLASLKSLFGDVSILGYDISPELEEPVAVFCPTNVGFLSLETGHVRSRALSADERKMLMGRLARYHGLSKLPKEILDEIRSDSVLLHVSSLDHGPSKFLTRFPCHKHLYTGGSAKKTLQKEDISLCHNVGFFMNPSGAQSQNIIFPIPAYDAAAQTILDAVQKGTQSPRVLFIGPKNSGKSTAFRYMTNKLRNISADVCYLECDPGQSEFTVPAVLSLHVIRGPLLGPPFTHLQEPERACFFGDVSPADDAETYIKMISALYKHYEDSFPHLPLFINTMGWVEGLGLRLLREIARLTHPTHVVQLVLEDEGPITLVPGEGDTELQHFSITPADDSPILPPEQTLTIPAKCQSDSYHASSQRELNILAALSGLLALQPRFQQLLAIPPCLVPWASVALRVCHQQVPCSQLLYAANASLVALCSTSPDQMEECGVEECEGLRVLSATPITQFMGVGIIRGIDPRKRLFYILPVVPRDMLPRVNTLLIGSPAIPECIFNQQCGSQELPYLSEGYDSQVCGSQAVRPKTYLKRGPGGKAVKT